MPKTTASASDTKTSVCPFSFRCPSPRLICALRTEAGHSHGFAQQQELLSELKRPAWPFVCRLLRLRFAARYQAVLGTTVVANRFRFVTQAEYRGLRNAARAGTLAPYGSTGMAIPWVLGKTTGPRALLFYRASEEMR